MIDIKPIQPAFRLNVLESGQLADIKVATLHLLERVGVRFPSPAALQVFAECGASVDPRSQIVKLPPELVLEAMKKAPRTYVLSGREPGTELLLDGNNTYFSTDGCGTITVDFDTGEQRSSCKEDVARMARVVDYLSSISFYWPMVSAQDYGRLAPLHELEASFNNTVKHVQMETVMGADFAHIAIRMAEAISGSGQAMRKKPPLSNLICTVAPLSQDKDGIEAAMVYAQSGIPVGFMSMPNMGATAPATMSGALALGNAEIVSAMVLMQLVAPGAPVFHSLLASVMDPRTGEYIVSLPAKYLCNIAAVQIAHDWGVPSLAGAFGLDHSEPATYYLGRDNVYTSLLVPLAGADMAVASGLLRASTLLLPEQILFDHETYQINRILSQGVDTSREALAIDITAAVGPGGHFLSQKHTRKHLREIWFPPLSHPHLDGNDSPLPDIMLQARSEFDRILQEHHPVELEGPLKKELNDILESARLELGI